MSNFFGTVKTNSPAVAIEAPVFEGYIAPTGTALMEIATEGVLEGLQIQAALHVADATIAYTSVNESAEKAEGVFESVVGSTIGRIKDGLKKLWSKMKAWFKSVAKSFQVTFTSGKDFVKKFKKEIEGKRSTGFEYQGHIWTVDAGNGKAEGALKSLNKIAESVLTGTAVSTDPDHKHDLSELKEKAISAVASVVGVSGTDADLSGIKEALAKAYRNGADEKVENKEFAKLGKGALIELIEKVDAHRKVIDDAEKIVDKQFAESLKALDKLEKEIAKSPDADYGDNASAKRAANAAHAAVVSNVTRYVQTLNSTIASAAVESIKASAKEAESVLKSFVRYKGVKESFGAEDLEQGASDVFEGFLQNIKL